VIYDFSEVFPFRTSYFNLTSAAAVSSLLMSPKIVVFLQWKNSNIIFYDLETLSVLQSYPLASTNGLNRFGSLFFLG